MNTLPAALMLTAGQELNPPVLLLHGSCSNSAFWFPEIMALSNHFQVYAVNMIGEAGNSEEYRPDLNLNAFALWMKEVLGALGLEKTAFIGNSLGGWMVLKFATAYPERVSKLILIASAGLAEIRPQFRINAEQARQAGGIVPVSSATIGEQSIPKEVLDFMNPIVENYDLVEDSSVYTDEELLRFDMPVAFIAGTEDAIIDAKASAQRLSRLVPSAAVHLLPECGHAVVYSIEYRGRSGRALLQRHHRPGPMAG